MRRDSLRLIVDDTTGEPIYEEIPENNVESNRLITEDPLYENIT